MMFCVVDSALAFAFIGLLWFGLRKWISAQFGYFLFLLVFLKFFIPSPVSLSDLVMGIQSEPTPGITGGERFQMDWLWLGGKRFADSDLQSIKTNGSGTDQPSAAQPPVISPVVYMMVGWFCILVFLLYRLAVRANRTRKFLKVTYPIDVNTYPIDLRRLESIAGLSRPIRWFAGVWVNTPIVYGILYPRIILPFEFEKQYTRSQMEWILLHELTHIKRNDLFVSLVQKLIQTVFFFNPLIVWLNAIVDRLREYSCDDRALKMTVISREDCGDGFLHVVAQANHISSMAPATLGVNHYKSMIRRRLMRILDSTHTPVSKLSFTAHVTIILFALIVCSFTGQSSMAQSMQWNQVIPQGISLEHRQGHSMCYDETRQKVILFGGLQEEPRDTHNETFEWDGSQWKEVEIDPQQRPSKRFLSAMAYDPIRKKIVLYGGADLMTYKSYQDTWEFDGTKWTQIDTPGCGIRFEHAMAFDPIRGKVLLFGGDEDLTYKGSNDLWEYDGSTWTQIPLDNAPSPRSFATMVLDEKRNKVVLFGGSVNDSQAFGDTWEWDGEQFTQVSESGPPPRAWFGMAYNSDREKVVLFGGGDFGQIYFNDTWEWDGNQWTQLDIPGPQKRAMIDLVYDKLRRTIVTFGGCGYDDPTIWSSYNDTWVLSSSSSGVSNDLWPFYFNTK